MGFHFPAFLSYFPGCFASGLAAFFHNSALSRKGQRQAQTLALCASLGLLPPFSATGGGGIRPRQARSTTASSRASSVSPSNSGNYVFSGNRAISAIAGPGCSTPWLGSGANSPSVLFFAHHMETLENIRKTMDSRCFAN